MKAICAALAFLFAVAVFAPASRVEYSIAAWSSR